MMSDAFNDMRNHALDRLRATSYDEPASPDELVALEWQLEVMDRIEAMERFLDRDEND